MGSYTLVNAAQLGTGGAAVGLEVWAPSRTYTVGTRSVSPSGRNIVCRETHTSASTFDATYWTYPGQRNESIIDFTLLPDGSITTAEPTVGCIANWGSNAFPSDLTIYRIVNGRGTTVGTAQGPNYLELQLPDNSATVKHLWAIYDIPSVFPNTSETNGTTLVLTSDSWNEAGSEFRAGVHWQLYTQVPSGSGYVPGLPTATWGIGPYSTIDNISFTGTIAPRSQTGVTRTTATLSNPFTTTNGSSTVRVSASNNGVVLGDWVTFSNVTNPFGGLNLNGLFQVIAVYGANEFDIKASANATSTAGPGGGASVGATYQTTGVVNDLIVITGVSATNAGSNPIIRPGMQISGTKSFNSNSSGTSLTSVPNSMFPFARVGTFVTGSNVPTEGTTVVSITNNGNGTSTVAVSNAVATTTGGAFVFSYTSGGIFQPIPNSDANGNPSAPMLPLRIQSQVSGTPGGAGTYKLNMPNISTTATVKGVVDGYTGTGLGLNVPLVGRTVRIDIIVDPDTGQISGYIDGVLIVLTANGTASAFSSYYGIIESINANNPTRELGISAILPEFYTNGANRVQYNDTNSFIDASAFPNPITSTNTWLLFKKLTVYYGSSGVVEVSFYPYIDCVAGRIEMMLSSAVLAPYTFYPTVLAYATTKNVVPFVQCRYGTPGSTEEIGIWVRTDGAGNRVNSTPSGLGNSPGGWGSLVVRQVNTSFSIV